jgi:hypothetical protein
MRFEIRTDTNDLNLQVFVGGYFLACYFREERCPTCLKEIYARADSAQQVVGKIETIEVHDSVVKISSNVMMRRALLAHAWQKDVQADFVFEIKAYAVHPITSGTLCCFGIIPGAYLELTIW